DRPLRRLCNRCRWRCRCTWTRSAGAEYRWLPLEALQTIDESRDCEKAWSFSSDFLEPNQERLVLRRPGVGVHRGWGEQVSQGTGMPGITRVAPVNWKTDVPHLLSIDRHRHQTFGDDRRTFDRSSGGSHFHPPAIQDPQLVGERFGDFEEES